jgi:drug/metabolite transporter (DMT)-like permease
MLNKKLAPFYVMLGASLWAIDGIFRTQLTFIVPTASIVLIEHLLGFLILSPIVFKHLSFFKKINLKTWIAILAMAVVSSVAGTLLFTEALRISFAGFDFATPILLQKLQPVFVILLSALFFREKITFKFIIASGAALMGSYLLSFGFNPTTLTLQGRELVFILSLGAAFAWGSGTILSKHSLSKIPFEFLTALRFGVAIPVAFLATLILNQGFSFGDISLGNWVRFLVISGITGGALAIYLYYKGLKYTQAKVATIAELAFPIVSLIIALTPLNPYGAPQQLSLDKLFGALILVVAMLYISLKEHEIIDEKAKNSKV